jgi:tRNA pseudouridine55 synthase
MHGVLNLDKPCGISSQEAVTRVKRVLRVKKAGHAGTLDPMATGVLLVCLGEATKISRFLMDLRKEYVFTMKFGEATDTLDAEGDVVETCRRTSFEIEEIREALEGFKGIIRQRPPMYSAIKVCGKPLYKMARKGMEALPLSDTPRLVLEGDLHQKPRRRPWAHPGLVRAHDRTGKNESGDVFFK